MKRTMLAFALLLLCWPISAFAHKPSDSYLNLVAGDEHLRIQWEIALRDLELLVGLDGNQDDQITWGEVRSRTDAIVNAVLPHLQLSADGKTYPLRCDDLLISKHSDGAYAVLELASDCPGDAAKIQLQYDLLFDRDPTHRGLVQYRSGDRSASLVLGPQSPMVEIDAEHLSRWRALGYYIVEGVWHIWIGYDHILFLLSLLLPAVFVRRDHAWQPVGSLRPAAREVLRIVTVFTLAHSITLWLSVSGYVSLPVRLVESVIALSIVITAMNNLFRWLPISGWMFAFIFGLVHGFGFANVLSDLGLQGSTLAVSLLGFNVGVELGQMAIVLVFMPFAFALRRTSFYYRVIFQAGCVVISLAAAIWFVERVFDLKIL